MSRLPLLVSGAIGDALGRTRTWTVAGWTTFFVFAAARVIVPARSDGSAGLSVFGTELLHALGRSPDAPAASLPIAILAGFLVCLPVAGFALAHGPLRVHLADRRLRVLALRCSRSELWLARLLGDSAVLGGITLTAGLLAAWNGHVRADALALSQTLGPAVGATALATVYGVVFVIAGHLVAVARQRALWLAAAIVLTIVLLAASSLAAPLGGLLSGGVGALGAVAVLAVAAAALGALGHALFQRVAL